MLEFFAKQDIEEFFQSFYNSLEDEICKMSNINILSCDFEEWTDYLVKKYSIVPITLLETNIEQRLEEIKIQRDNPLRGYPYQLDYVETDGICITFTIPFDGNPKLLEMRPRISILLGFCVKNFREPSETEYGSFSIELRYTKRELQEKGNNMAAFVRQEFENSFSNYRTMVNNVNSEVKSFNIGLGAQVKKLLEKRKEKASSSVEISNALQIPLTQSKNSPNTKPIQLHKMVERPTPRPRTKLGMPEPYISDNDYRNINNIILTYGTTMEKTARTYYLNREEELRDHLLAALNTHYEAATGETFRKIGKTDIQIEFENKAAFIGECKIWHGEKLFRDAIQQVLNYSTWRDLKVSVIIFNKENQSFFSILSKIQKWVENNTKSYTQLQKNVWSCKYYRQDVNVDIHLTILAFDLYVDKSQFKDTRY